MTFSMYEQRLSYDTGRVVKAPHKVVQFPGGEVHVDFQQATSTRQIALLQGASGDDLMTLAMWADAVRKSDQNLRSILMLPYLPGARMDRGVPFGAKVYADFINSLQLDQVITVDPHSDVMPALLNNLSVVNIDELPNWDVISKLGHYTGVVAPDAGARKRAEAVGARLGVPTYQAQKHRDFATGKLSGFTCEDLPSDGKFILVDDICDGGGTFLGLADHLALDRSQLDLWVTHGIYSKGAVEKLEQKFGNIYNTNSHPGATNNPNRTGGHILIPMTGKVR